MYQRAPLQGTGAGLERFIGADAINFIFSGVRRTQLEFGGGLRRTLNVVSYFNMLSACFGLAAIMNAE